MIESHRHPEGPGNPGGSRLLGGAIRLVALLAVAFALLVLAGLARNGGTGAWLGAGAPVETRAPSPSPTQLAGETPNPSALVAYLLRVPRPAPPLVLTDPDGQQLSLASLGGGPVLVFFGYTHCPDVCPATIGILGEAMRAADSGVHAVFASIDPERDTVPWLKAYSAYLPAGIIPVTGTPGEVRTAADAWGIKYARVDSGVPGAYSMSHTADVFLVDSAGFLRARFPFGTESDTIAAAVRYVAASPSVAASTPSSAASSPAGASSTATASATPGPAGATPETGTSGATVVGALRVEVVSSSVWAGGASPIILALYGPAGRLNDTSVSPTVQLVSHDGADTGSPVRAVAVRPVGIVDVSYVVTLGIPAPGWWRLDVAAAPGALTLRGSADVPVLDPGATAALGQPAPTSHTPTLDDVGGDPRAVTTDPAPDLRLSRTSTTDALAAHQPFVLVVDSTRFRVTSACGKAVIMARYLLDRWPSIAFIHLEPYRYSIVTDTPVLDGTLSDPPLTDVAAAWGIGGAPWGALSMPWVFVVDGNGTVRAKYQGVIGSDDVDVMLSLIGTGG